MTTVAVTTNPRPIGSTDVVMSRCVMVSAFNDDMYESILAPDGPPVEEMVRAGVVDHLPGRPTRYRLTPGLVRTALSIWGTTERRHTADRPWPLALQQFARSVADYCGTHGRPAEQLRILLNLGEAAGRTFASDFTQVFAEAFRQARQTGDRGRCAALVEIAEEARNTGVDALDAHLPDSRDELATLRWAGRHLAIGHGVHLERAALQRDLRTSLEKHRTVLVKGSPGRGKSTLLRHWLDDHHIIPLREHGLQDLPYRACAYVDFDRFPPGEATRNPRAVLLEIARQLDGQLDGRILADRSPDGPPDPDDEVRFAHELRAQATPEQPVLAVLDTFELVTVLDDETTRPLSRLLRRVADEAGGALRIVIAGRSTAGERQLRDTFDIVSPVQVGLFTEGECRTYLDRRWDTSALRGRWGDEWRRRVWDLSAIAHRKSEGNAWVLDLCADIVAEQPDITSAELEREDVRIAWAVRRILDRIPDLHVRWLVLLGCVLRRLDRTVVADILRDVIVAHTDTSAPMPPLHERRPGLFATGINVPDVDRLWSDLLAYLDSGWTEAASWLRPDEETDGVVFDELLREPMIRLFDEVESGTAARDLHAALTDHFARRADHDEDGWFPLIRESLHHRTCWLRRRTAPDARRRATEAEERWGAVLARLRGTDRPEWTVVLAGDVLAPADRPDDDLSVPDHRVVDATALPDAIRRSARQERMWALVRLARRPDDDEWAHFGGGVGHPGEWRWTERGSRGSGLLDRARADLAAADPDAWTSVAAAAALARIDSRPEDALRYIDELPEQPDLAVHDRREVWLLKAECAFVLGRVRQARTALDEALQLSPGLADAQAVRMRLVAVHAFAGEMTAAGSHLQHLPAAANHRLKARLAHAGGQFEMIDAVERATVGSVSPTWSPEHVEALVALHRPEDAWAASRTDPRVPTDRDDDLLSEPSDPFRAAVAQLDQGIALAGLLTVDDAVAALSAAARRFRSLRRWTEAAFCAERLARFQVHVVGNVRDTMEQLDALMVAGDVEGSPEWVRRRLLRSEIAHASGHADPSGLDEVLTVLARQPQPMPALVVEAAVITVTVAPAGAAELTTRATDLLRIHLPRIEPIGARLAALAEVDRLPTGCLPEDLAEMVAPEPDEAEFGSTALWRQSRRAEVYRACGHIEQARDAAERGWDMRARRSLAGVRRQLAAAVRLDAAGAACLPTVRRPAATVQETGTRSRLLAAAWFVEVLAARRAGARSTRRSDDPDAQLVEQADRLLFDRPEAGPDILGRPVAEWDPPPLRTTQWHLRLVEHRITMAPDRRRPSRRQRDELAGLDEVAAAYRAELGRVPPHRPDQQREENVLSVVFEDAGPLVVSDGVTEMLRLAPADPLVRALRATTAHRTEVAGVLTTRLDIAGGPLQLAAATGSPHDRPVLMLTGTSRIAELPWELARVGTKPATDRYTLVRGPLRETRAEVVVLQEALAAYDTDAGGRLYSGPIDGEAGPLTRTALREFARLSGRPSAVRVAVWQVLRWAATEGGTTQVWTPTELPTVDNAQPADIIRLRCRMTDEHVTGRPLLRFARAGRGLSDVLDTNQLSSLIGTLTRAGRRTPIVVLDVLADVPKPLRTLLLRNAFAHALIATGVVHTVLATGLALPGDDDGWAASLDTELAEAPTADRLAVALQRHRRAVGDPWTALPWAATALFTSVRPQFQPTLRGPRVRVGAT